MGSDDIESGQRGANFMGDFFGQVAEIKKVMEQVKANIEDLEKKQSKALTDVYGGAGACPLVRRRSDEPSRLRPSFSQHDATTSFAQLYHVSHLGSAVPTADYKQEIEDLTDDTNAMAGRVRSHLTQMDAELKRMIQQDPSANQTSDYKIRRNMHSTLTKKFMLLMESYQSCQTKYKTKYQETVKRQFKIVKPDATDDEVEQVLEGGGEAIFTEHMLASRNAQARAALEDVQEKHKDIQRLESSIQELHQLFVDLSVLVESQGELLDQIEYSVSQSLSYTKTGVKELESANVYARKSRKKMCYIVVFLLVVAIFVVGPMLFG